MLPLQALVLLSAGSEPEKNGDCALASKQCVQKSATHHNGKAGLVRELIGHPEIFSITVKQAFMFSLN